MPDMKSIILEMIEARLQESAKLTNGEALKIGKLAKKEAESTRKQSKKEMDVYDKDASFLDSFAKDCFARDVKAITRTMNGGETENREDVFAIVSKVIGKDRAEDLAKGRY